MNYTNNSTYNYISYMIQLIPKTTGIRGFLKRYKNFIKEMKDTNEPLILLNHSEPECVMLSVKEYNRLAKLVEESQDIERVEKIIEKEKHVKGISINDMFQIARR